MSSLFKAYALPTLILLIGIGLYYVMFSKNAIRHLEKTTQTSISTSKDKDNATNIGIIEQINIDTLARTKDINNQIDTNNNQDTQTPTEVQQTTSTQTAGNETNTPLVSLSQNNIEAVYYVQATSVNVRLAPSIKSKVIDKKTLGQKVVVAQIQGEWAQLDSGGWISKTLLSAVEPNQKPYFVLIDRLNVRENALSDARVIGLLHKNQQIRIIQIQGEWAQLDSGGWVASRFIKEVQ